MIQTVQLSDFRTAFAQCGRQSQFSYQALEMIFDYVEEYERDSGEQVELDVIALCCEWSESTPEKIAQSYDIDIEGLSEEEALETVLDWLHNETQVAGVTNGNIVYVQF